jgi:hypothetical protein
MQYRGVEYTVVRTVPKGWRWTVMRENRREKAGRAYSRANGMVLARKFIDELIRLCDRPTTDAPIAAALSDIKNP